MAKKKSTVNKAGNYTKPGLRKRIFNRIKASVLQLLTMVQVQAKAAGGGYK